MRTYRIRTAGIAATALAAALSLTACQNDGGARDEGSGPSSSVPADKAPTGATSKGKDTPADPTAGTASGGSSGSGTSGNAAGKGSTGGNGGGHGDDSGRADEACTGATAKVTYSTVQRPINHALLTLTNTGSKTCNAYHAPLLRIDDAQAVTAINQESKPQAVVTLAPGESAYASIMLAAADGSGEGGRTAKTLAVSFAPRSGSGSTNTAPTVLTLPADTYTDSSTSVSYWQSSMDDALMY